MNTRPAEAVTVAMPKPLVRRRARWWVEDYAYAGYWQLRSAVSHAKPGDYRHGSGRPVLVIPGIYENWQFMRPLIDALHTSGHPVHVVTLLRYNRRPVQEAARMVADYIAGHNLRDAAIVAHSKGGLIGKYAMLKLDTDLRIARMIAICSPFSGSRYARFAPARSLRAFAPNDVTTRLLARERRLNGRITSVFGRFDPLIPEGSVLPGARNIQLDVGGHFRIIGDRRTIRVVLAEVGVT